jgi:hypothetical protein
MFFCKHFVHILYTQSDVTMCFFFFFFKLPKGVGQGKLGHFPSPMSSLSLSDHPSLPEFLKGAKNFSNPTISHIGFSSPAPKTVADNQLSTSLCVSVCVNFSDPTISHIGFSSPAPKTVAGNQLSTSVCVCVTISQ